MQDWPLGLPEAPIRQGTLDGALPTTCFLDAPSSLLIETLRAHPHAAEGCVVFGPAASVLRLWGAGSVDEAKRVMAGERKDGKDSGAAGDLDVFGEVFGYLNAPHLLQAAWGVEGTDGKVAVAHAVAIPSLPDHAMSLRAAVEEWFGNVRRCDLLPSIIPIRISLDCSLDRLPAARDTDTDTAIPTTLRLREMASGMVRRCVLSGAILFYRTSRHYVAAVRKGDGWVVFDNQSSPSRAGPFVRDGIRPPPGGLGEVKVRQVWYVRMEEHRVEERPVTRSTRRVVAPVEVE